MPTAKYQLTIFSSASFVVLLLGNEYLSRILLIILNENTIVQANDFKMKLNSVSI